MNRRVCPAPGGGAGTTPANPRWRADKGDVSYTACGQGRRFLDGLRTSPTILGAVGDKGGDSQNARHAADRSGEKNGALGYTPYVRLRSPASEGSRMEDLEPSVPRTPTQAVLRMVSILMGGIGALVLVGGLLVLVPGVLGGSDLWASVTFGVMILVVAGLLVLTAVLGLAASNNSARVGPYRFLCYLVGLAVLVAIVWGWGMGTFILFNPIVLTTTIVYVLICSRLADKVKEEHDEGVRGEPFSLIYTGRGGNENVIEQIVEDLAAVGIECEPEELEEQVFYERVRSGDYQIARLDAVTDRPVAESVLFPLFHSRSRGGSNVSGFASEEVDSLIDQARAARDDASREALLAEADTLIGEEAPIIPLTYPMHAFACTAKANGLVIDPAGVPRLAEIPPEE